MRRWYVFLYATVSLALAGSSLPEKASAGQWGDDQIFQFAAPTPTREYTVYGLTRPTANPSVVLKPLSQGSVPVDTASQKVTLSTKTEARATQDYTTQQVAYLRVNFEVSVQEGTLTRTQGGSSRDIAAIRPGLNITAPWVVGWLGTFGLIGIFAWPNATATSTYDEVVPLNAPPITYSVGGGGGCLAFNGTWDSITVYPNQLQPGRLYELKVGLRCGGLFQGNLAFVGQEAGDLIGLRWERDGAWQNSPFPPGGLGVDHPRYPFSRLLPDNTYLYYEVPTPGYYAHAVAIDTGVFNTKSAPVQPGVSVPYQLRSLTSRIVRDPDSGDPTQLFTGFAVYSLPDHPILGPVAVQETYTDSETPTKITLLRLLPGSDPVEGTKNFTLSDFSLGVNSVTYQTQIQSQNGSTVTRSVPVYNLNPPATHDIVIRTQSVVDCTWEGLKTYYCGSVYGRFRNGAWQ